MFKPEGFSSPVWLDLDAIDPRPASEVRAEHSEEAVDRYAESLDDLGPVHVIADPDGTHWLADGRHRWEAHRLRKRGRIQCCVKAGTYADAYAHACRANETHGVPTSKGDKRHRVIRALENPILAGLPNTEVARICAVGEAYVRKLRPERSNSHCANSNASTGEYRTAKEKREDVLSTIDAHPDWSDRKIATACDVGPELVAKVRRQLETEKQLRHTPAEQSGSTHQSTSPPTSDQEPDPSAIAAKEEINATFSIAGRESGGFDAYDAFRPVEQLVHETLEHWPEDEHAEFAYQLHVLSSQINSQVGYTIEECA